jgi:ADP-heptose:LPS heptosyltransferase
MKFRRYKKIFTIIIHSCIVNLFIVWRHFFSINRKNGDKILIIKIDAIGDAILFLPIIEYLKELEMQFDLICSIDSFEIYKLAGGFDKIYAIDYKKFLSTSILSYIYKIKQLNILSKIRYKSIIQTRYTRSFFVEDSIVSVCNARKKIGIAGEVDFSSKRIFIKSKYDVLFQVNSNLHELEKNFYFFNKVFNTQWTFNFESILRYFKGEKVIEDKYFIIFPGARDGIRHWPVNYFSETAIYVLNKYGLIPVICGSKGEAHLAREIINKVEAIDYTGKTNIVELINLIAHSKLVISNETAAIHIAAATNVPSICITGGGHFNRFVPYPSSMNVLVPPSIVYFPMSCYNCNWNCIHGADINTPAPCITQITTEMVIQKIDTYLKEIF